MTTVRPIAWCWAGKLYIKFSDNSVMLARDWKRRRWLELLDAQSRFLTDRDPGDETE